MGLKDVYLLLKINLNTVFLTFLIISTSYSLKLTAKNSRDGSETFIKCETVTLECVIQPYTDTLSWKYDTKEVAACSFSNCQAGSDTHGFDFTFDATNGIFKLKIDKVKDEYNSKVFECFDGTSTESVTAKLDDKGWRSYNFAILFAVIIFFNIVAAVCNIVCCNTGSSMLKAIKRFWFPIGYFAVGILLIVILIIVTRFSEDSVVEEYDHLCGYEILLILFGIYVFAAALLFVALILKVLCR